MNYKNVDKIYFFSIYINLIDIYYEKNIYQELILRLNEINDKPRIPDNNPVNLIIANLIGKSSLDFIKTDDYLFQNINNVFDHVSLSDYQNEPSIIQLKKALASFNSKSKLVKVFYHLAIVLFVNRYHDSISIRNINFIPFNVLDEKQESLNNKIFEISSFLNKYPIFAPEYNDLNKNGNDSPFSVDNLTSYTNRKKEESFFILENYFILNLTLEYGSSISSFLEDNDLREMNTLLFNELEDFSFFDVNYFSESYLKLTYKDLSEYIDYEVIEHGISFGYENMEYQKYAGEQYNLNLDKFVVKLMS